MLAKSARVAVSAVRHLLKALGVFLLLLVILWGSLAIRFSNLPWEAPRIGLGVAFFGFSVWALWFSRNRKLRWVFCCLYALVVVWFISIQPSHERPWRTEVGIMPRATVQGDAVTFSGVRDFEFRSTTDFTPRYIERKVSLSHLQSMDLFISYWKLGPVGHTFVSFNFDNADPVCISIETRPEVGESFAPIGSLFKQFELIYLVGEERDLVGSRTKHRDEDVFLYRINASPEAVRRLFLIYLERINELADRAEFYNLISNSCTINIIRYTNRAGRTGRWEIKHFLNGWIDRYLYRTGRIVTGDLTFEEYRQRAHINEAANAVPPGENFSKAIRAALP